MLRYFKIITIYQYHWDISSNIFDIYIGLRQIQSRLNFSKYLMKNSDQA